MSAEIPCLDSMLSNYLCDFSLYRHSCLILKIRFRDQYKAPTLTNRSNRRPGQQEAAMEAMVSVQDSLTTWPRSWRPLAWLPRPRTLLRSPGTQADEKCCQPSYFPPVDSLLSDTTDYETARLL